MSLRRNAVDRFTGDSPLRRLLRRIDASVYRRFRGPLATGSPVVPVVQVVQVHGDPEESL